MGLQGAKRDFCSGRTKGVQVVKQGGTLSDVLGLIKSVEKQKRDYVAPQAAIRMTLDPQHEPMLQLIQHPDAPSEAVAGPAFGLRTRAHRQLAGELQIPQSFYDRLLAEEPELLKATVNTLILQRPEEKRMVRTVGDRVRAVLSSRYRPLDNYDLAEAVLPLLTADGVRIESVGLTEDRFYLKAVSDRVQGEVKVGDIVSAGLSISNSEVGAGSLRVEPFLFRLICSNGAIRNEAKMRKYHVGRRAEEGDNFELLSDETRRADDKAFFLKVRDGVKAAFDAAFFQAGLNEMRRAAGQHIEIAPAAVVELLQDQLREEERGRVLEAYIQGGDNSVYGVANAVTLASQAVEDYDRATELERLGGALIDGSVKLLE